jgi:hypothetical protein
MESWSERIVMPKRKSHIKHSVEATFRVPSLSRAGSSLNLEIYADKEKIGTIVLGRGSLYWYGRNRQKGKRISWSRFAQMMDELAYG